MRVHGAERAKNFFNQYSHKFWNRRGNDLDFMTRENCRLLGSHINMKANSNPSDIQWEHKERSNLQFFVKFILHSLIGLILTVLFFGVITFMKRNSEAAQNLLYSESRCESLLFVYQNNLQSLVDKAKEEVVNIGSDFYDQIETGSFWFNLNSNSENFERHQKMHLNCACYALEDKYQSPDT